MNKNGDDKMKEFKKKKIVYQICSFLIPFILFLIILLSRNDNFQSLLISDANEQYSYLFQYLKNILDGKESLFYSFSKGLGGSMFGTFFYYLASPINLFLLFISKNQVLDFLGFVMIFKMSLSGFTMFYYLKNKNKHDFINFVLSLSYAFMSYNMMYYFNVMWLDAIYLLPLVIKGLDTILDNKKSVSYILFLFLTILSNYYIAYMVCIFLVLYFCYRLFTLYNWEKDRRAMFEILKKFIICSLFAGLLSAFFLIPVIIELKASVRELLFYGEDTVWNRSMSAFFQIGIQKQSTTILYSVPYFFCNFFVFGVLINYLFCKKKQIGKNAFYVMLIIFFLSIILKPLIYIWHGFTYPILFTNRWTFIISFFLIISASEAYQYLEKLSLYKILSFTISYILLLIVSYWIIGEELNFYILFINGFFCVANLLLLNILLMYNSPFYKLGVLLLCLVEVFIVMKLNFLTSSSFDTKKDLVVNQKIEKINQELNRITNSGYRIGGDSIYQKNELINTDFSRISSFLSTVNGRVTTFLKQSGYSSSSSDFSDHCNQDLMNSLLGIRYWYGKRPSNLFKKVNTMYLEKEIPVYENELTPSFGYLIKKNETTVDTSNPFAYQNSFLETIGYKPLFKNKKVTKLENNEYQIEVNKEQTLYFYITSKEKNDYPKKILLNNEEIREKYFLYSGILKISVNPDLKKVNLKIEGKGTIDKVFVYSFDEEGLKEMLENLKKNEIKEVKKEKNRLEFDFLAPKDNSTLLLTLPYEKGWHINVDGKSISYENFLDTFISLKLSKGKHHIHMYYIPSWLIFGSLISFCSFVGCILYVKRK